MENDKVKPLRSITGGKGKSADLELRELAFQIYRECGGNKELTIRKLEEEGYTISKPTLYDWIKKFNFDERMTNADLKVQAAKDAGLSNEELILIDLNKQKGKYERYFERLGVRIDNQAQYAYNNLVITILNIKSKIGADKASLFMEFMRELVGYLSKEDPEAVQIIERNLDAFAAHVKEKYGS